MDAELTQDFIKAAQNPPPALYATAPAKARLGWMADRLAGWAGMNVLFIRHDDLPGYVDMDMLAHFIPEEHADEGFPDNAVLGLRHLAQDAGYGIASIENGAVGDNFPYEHSVITTYAAYKHIGMALPLPLNNYLGTEPLCIITDMFDGSSVAHQLEKITGIPEDDQRFDITWADFDYFFLRHEAGHCATLTLHPAENGAELLRNEILADQEMLNDVPLLTKQGHIQSPGLAEQIIDLRVLSTVFAGDQQHMTSIAINLGEAAPDYSIFASDTDADPEYKSTKDGLVRTDDLSQVIMAVHQALTSQYGTTYYESLKGQSALPVYQAMLRLIHEGRFDRSPVQAKLAGQFEAALHRRATPGFLEQIDAFMPAPPKPPSGGFHPPVTISRSPR